MAIVFWVWCFQPGKRHYDQGILRQLLNKFKGAIQPKRPHLVKQNHDNAPALTSKVVATKLNDLRFEVLPGAPYSSNLALSDYFIFPKLKKWLAGRKLRQTLILQRWTNSIILKVLKSWFKCIVMLENNKKMCFLCQVENFLNHPCTSNTLRDRYKEFN